MSLTLTPGPVLGLELVDGGQVVNLSVQTTPSFTMALAVGQGPSGTGLPSGGFTGQVLAKDSNVDLDYSWQYVSAAAVDVTVTPAGGIASSDVQSALVELDTEKYGSGAAAVFASVQLSGGTGNQGKLTWNSDELTLDLVQNGVTLQLGQENQIVCYNNSGSTIPNGKLVMFTGSTGITGNPTITLMDGSVSANFPKMLGMATEDIANNTVGKITTFGKVRDIDTSAYVDGATLYCNPAVAGGITTTEPTSGVDAAIGIVLRAHPTLGVVLVKLSGSDENHITPPIQKLIDGKANQTGFPADAAGNYLVALSYNETTRTVTLTPTGATFDVYVMGVKYTFTGAQSIVHSATGAAQFIYFNSTGVLTVATTPWDLLTTAPACFVFQDVTNSRRIAFDERHHAGRDVWWHRNQHTNEGTKVSSGFVASGYTLNDGSSDTTTQWAVASGRVEDEDIRIDTQAFPAAGPYNILERVGASGEWQLTRTSTQPFLYSGNNLQYNQYTGATWQRTNVTEDSYVNYWIYATTSLPTTSITPAPTNTQQVVVVAGQTLFTSSDLASGEIPSSIVWGTLPFQEMAPLYRVTLRYNASSPGAYTNTARTAISAITRMVGTYTSLTAASVTDHGALSGLSDPDHPASAIVFTPVGSIAATTVQAAIAELDTEKLPVAGGTLTGAVNYAATQTIASATTTDIGAATSNAIIVSGTTTITGLGTIAAGAERAVTFSGVLTLTHNVTSLILPGAASITTAAGDSAYFISLGSGNWRCTSYQKASGAAVAGGSATLTVDNKTAAYVVVAGDNGKIIRTTSGTGAITLPSCAAVGVGFNFIYTNETSANITIQRVGSDFMPGNNNQWNVGPNCVVRLVVVDNSASGLWSILQVNASGTSGGVGIGSGALASGLDAVAIAKNTTASSSYSTAIGKNSGGTASQAVTGGGAMALGGSYASGLDSFAAAIGDNTSNYGAQGNDSIAMGYQAKATGYCSTVLGGLQGAASGSYSVALGGNTTTASATGSIAMGYYAKSAQVCKVAFGSAAGGSSGAAQAGITMLYGATTTNAGVVLSSDPNTASTTNQLIVGTNQVMAFTGTLIAKQSGSANIAAYEIKGTLVNNAGTVTMPTGTLTLIGTDSIGLLAGPSLSADNTNKGLSVGSGYKTTTAIKWFCTIYSTELTY